MNDAHCVAFLTWALPRLHMRWEGFRRVHGQVCKRIARRVRTLALPDVAAYRDYLEAHPAEWQNLDNLCYVTVSRFYREKAVFAFLADAVLPALADQARERGDHTLRAWSAGCARGEEPYTLVLTWAFSAPLHRCGVHLETIATDANAELLRQARAARYAWSSVRNLPGTWRERAFTREDEQYCLKAEYRNEVRFEHQDIRQTVPNGPFDIILCRNLVFTYYDLPLQRRLLARLGALMRPGAALVLGIRERLPDIDREAAEQLVPWSSRLCVFRKAGCAPRELDRAPRGQSA